MSNLSNKKCIPCESDFPPMTYEQARDLMEHVPGWTLSQDGRKLTRLIHFTNFKDSLAFANEIGMLAEEEGHHPDMLVSWGKLEVTLSTHSIQGLAENDFVMASKIGDLLRPSSLE